MALMKVGQYQNQCRYNWWGPSLVWTSRCLSGQLFGQALKVKLSSAAAARQSGQLSNGRRGGGAAAADGLEWAKAGAIRRYFIVAVFYMST